MRNQLNLDTARNMVGLMKLRARGLSTKSRNQMQQEIDLLNVSIAELINLKNMFQTRCEVYETHLRELDKQKVD